MRAISLILFPVLLMNAGIQAADITFQSSARQTALLELYTSEGCSSCPPAESWLSRLKESPGLWLDFVPLAFHVDYWDRLGWRDPWGATEFSNRQRGYAALWRSESIYTPAFAANGAERRDWSPLARAPGPAKANPGVLKAITSDSVHWRVLFTPSTPGLTDYEVHAAVLGGGLISSVQAGENRGRQLAHDFAVLTLANASVAFHSGMAQGEFALAAPKLSAENSLALAVWITPKGRLEPIQATGGWLRQAAAK